MFSGLEQGLGSLTGRCWQLGHVPAPYSFEIPQPFASFTSSTVTLVGAA